MQTLFDIYRKAYTDQGFDETVSSFLAALLVEENTVLNTDESE